MGSGQPCPASPGQRPATRLGFHVWPAGLAVSRYPPRPETTLGRKAQTRTRTPQRTGPVLHNAGPPGRWAAGHRPAAPRWIHAWPQVQSARSAPRLCFPPRGAPRRKQRRARPRATAPKLRSHTRPLGGPPERAALGSRHRARNASQRPGQSWAARACSRGQAVMPAAGPTMAAALATFRRRPRGWESPQGPGPGANLATPRAVRESATGQL
mmetsp:Transcript_89342/g.248138  ORF Transcript_89342/g.248138 Transcript_89342/m.248138 type:complete len:212 (+) Transcript_89342:613-1248(+)